MAEQSTIRAYQKILPTWRFGQASSFGETFAQQRFHKKMEEPGSTDHLPEKAWCDFMSFDSTLPTNLRLPPSEWYKARALIHKWLGAVPFRHSVDFPSGSSFNPTAGRNSIESRLARGHWTCTRENFDEFCRLAYSHKAIKRAFRKRYDRWYRSKGFDIPRATADRLIWRRFKGDKWKVFLWKMERVVEFTRGSRFSTVPKNNEAARPINLEPFGNIVTQRSCGLYIKKVLRQSVGVNLDTLADLHGARIKDMRYATVDLKNASDAVSLALCEFLLPQSFYKRITAYRSPMVLGFDNHYHITRKVSSMGNGFTFELMTLILTAVCRTLDPSATVFGDDIIIKATAAPRLYQLLNSVGFVVNEDKSFTSGPFRESCGANFHSSEGYIDSFDFKYPVTIADCALIYNKSAKLALKYPTFEKLRRKLFALTPKALRGGTLERAVTTTKGRPDVSEIPLYFACNAKGKELSKTALTMKNSYQWGETSSFYGWKFVNDTASNTLHHINPRFGWAKYEMYLMAGRRADDVITGEGRWVRVELVQAEGAVMRSKLPVVRYPDKGHSHLSTD